MTNDEQRLNPAVRLLIATLRARGLTEGDKPPGNPTIRISDKPDSGVHFRIDEILNGRKAPTGLVLSGYLGSTDDFNDQPASYKFVRPGGRACSCFANTYRLGAEYLLVPKLVGNAYTVGWYALGATTSNSIHTTIRGSCGCEVR